MKKKQTLIMKIVDNGKNHDIKWGSSFVPTKNVELPTAVTQDNQESPFTMTVCTKDNCTCDR